MSDFKNYMVNYEEDDFISLINCLPNVYNEDILEVYNQSFELKNSKDEIYEYCLNEFIRNVGVSAGFRTIFWDIPTMLRDYYFEYDYESKHPFENKKTYKGFEHIDISFSNLEENTCILFRMIVDNIIDERFKSDFIFCWRKYLHSCAYRSRNDFYESFRYEIVNHF